MAKFIKKPPVVEAVQFHKGEQPEELAPYLGSRVQFSSDKSSVKIKSPHHGPLEAVEGDWIVMDGATISIVKPEAFEAMYAPMADASPSKPAFTQQHTAVAKPLDGKAQGGEPWKEGDSLAAPKDPPKPVAKPVAPPPPPPAAEPAFVENE